MAELQGVFIQNLKRFRAEAGMTQFALAETAAMSPGYIAELESGRKVPSLEALERLAAALGISASRLLAEGAEQLALTRARQPYLLAAEGKDAFIAEVVDLVRRHLPPLEGEAPGGGTGGLGEGSSSSGK